MGGLLKAMGAYDKEVIKAATGKIQRSSRTASQVSDPAILFKFSAMIKTIFYLLFWYHFIHVGTISFFVICYKDNK